MSDILFALGVLIHTLGLIVWAGGEIWITVFVIKAQKSKKPHGMAFILEMMHTVDKVMMTGLVLVLVGGFMRIAGANALGIYADPSYLWSVMMITKHALIVVLIITSLIITKKLAPVIVANAPGPNTPPNEKFERSIGMLERLSRTNLFITIVIIVISVGAVTI